MKIDELDQEIIALLKKDGRMPNNKIAKKLKVSEGTIRNRIKKLYGYKYLHVEGLVNPNLVPDKQVFYIGIRIDRGVNSQKIGDALSKVSEISTVVVVSGRWDILVTAFVSADDMSDFLFNRVANIAGVVGTESILVLKNVLNWV